MRTGRPAHPGGIDPRVCGRCFGAAATGGHGDGKCAERLDLNGAAAIVGVAPATWLRMCADTPPGGSRRRQGPEPDWRRVQCADNRYRNLWKRETVEHYAANRPGRGAGGGRPRKTEA